MTVRITTTTTTYELLTLKDNVYLSKQTQKKKKKLRVKISDSPKEQKDPVC